MTNYRVLGYKPCSGVFEGRNWAHTKVFCAVSEKQDGLIGEKVTILKAPSDLDTSKLVIGKTYAGCFDQYGNLVDLYEAKAS